MSKNFQGVENAIFYATIPTVDGRWMVFAGIDGKQVILPGFLGSKEDADAVADALSNKAYVDILMPPLIARWQRLNDDDDDLIPLLEVSSGYCYGHRSN